jgi:hypothetical protein
MGCSEAGFSNSPALAARGARCNRRQTRATEVAKVWLLWKDCAQSCETYRTLIKLEQAADYESFYESRDGL